MKSRRQNLPGRKRMKVILATSLAYCPDLFMAKTPKKMMKKVTKLSICTYCLDADRNCLCRIQSKKNDHICQTCTANYLLGHCMTCLEKKILGGWDGTSHLARQKTDYYKYAKERKDQTRISRDHQIKYSQKIWQIQILAVKIQVNWIKAVSQRIELPFSWTKN